MNYLDVAPIMWVGIGLIVVGIAVAILVILGLLLFFVVRYNNNKEK